MGFAAGEPCRAGVQSHQLSRAVREHKQVTADLAPEVGGRILDGGLVLSRHQCLQRNKTGKQRRRSREHQIALVLEILERGDRVAEGLEDFLTNV